MGRILLGLLKGGIVGAAIAYLAGRIGLATGTIALLMYGVIGAVVGLVCGKPLWRQETLFTPLLKALFGFGVGIGVTFLARKFLSGVTLPIAAIPGAAEHPFPDVPLLLGPAIGILYGALIELDDGAAATPPAKSKGKN
jgi:hypothetical protein